MPKRVAPIALVRHIAVLMNYITKYHDFVLSVDPKKTSAPAVPKRNPGRPRQNA